jgi:hypothetical protein
MSKKLDTTAIQNELSGQSAFFRQPVKSSLPDDEHTNMTPSKHDTVIPRHHDTGMVEAVRKALKIFGKEAATHRFTLEEKQAIAELVFAFRKKNIRTNENEIARVAINWLILDYRNNKDNSILAEVLLALNS